MTAKMSASGGSGARGARRCPRVLRRGEQPQLGAGAAGRRLDLGRRRENALGDADLSIRLRQRRPSGREVVEHERALVHLGEEARAHHPHQHDPRADEHEGRHADAARVMEDGGERALVLRPQSVERRLSARQHAAARRLDLLRGYKLLGEQRDDRQGKQERHQDGDRQRRREGGEELAHDALQQAEREETRPPWSTSRSSPAKSAPGPRRGWRAYGPV